MNMIKPTHNSQSGFVSIIVAVIFVVIVSLITTSFALLSRREQRQALDRQLSTQAFYAAESGVNDAIQRINAGGGDVTECNQAGTISPSKGASLGNGMEYTCALINKTPNSIEAQVGTDDSTIVRVQGPANTTIGSMRISWQAASGEAGFANNAYHYLPQEDYNTNPQANSFANITGLLRTTIIPVTGSLKRDTLISDSQTLFLYPQASATANVTGTTPYTKGQPNQQGSFADGQCNEANGSNGLPRYCNVLVTGLNAAGTNTFYVRLTGMYQPANVTIQAFTNTGAAVGALSLSNGQAVVDVTGKSGDVLRRIQVRVPVNADYYYPEYALESAESICKRLTRAANGTVSDPCNYISQ